MKLRNALVAATMMALPVAANAQAVNGIYLGAGAGVNIMQSERLNSLSGTGTAGTGSLQSRLGPAAVLSLGYGFGNGLRAEIEGSFRYNSLNGLSSAPPNTNISMTEQKFGGMVNVLYDFVNVIPMVQPYLGAGVGYQAAMLSSDNSVVGGTRFNVPNSTKGSFAYQAILGMALPIEGAPGLALTAEYRFMGMQGNRSYATNITTAAGVTSRGTLSVSSSYNHSVLLGVRYNFGQAPAAAPVAAAPAAQPSRSYLVFFDWDKATLTDRAKGIIKEAADNSRKVQYTRIEVNGFTDTSGTPKYNQGLSVRRAQAVAAELVRNGVARNSITIQGFGDTKLLVPTGPNVREPQNRRVEIIIR